MPSFDQLTLRTKRLLLRPLAQSDATSMFALYAEPEVMRYWGHPAWSSIDQATDLIDRDLRAMSAGEYLRFGVERADDGLLVGNCCLFDFKAPSRRAELGYNLASFAWGRGYMKESLVAILNFGFTQLSLNRVEADTDPRNTASLKLLERLGFKKEGHLRERWIVAGEVSDTALYGLLLRDWQHLGGSEAP